MIAYAPMARDDSESWRKLNQFLCFVFKMVTELSLLFIIALDNFAHQFLCPRFVGSFIVSQTISMGRRKFSADFQLVFRLIKGLIFVTFVSILIILILIPHMTLLDIFVCFLAFMPTGWGLLLVSEFIELTPISYDFRFSCCLLLA